MKLLPIPTPDDWRTMPFHPLAEIVPFGLGIDMEQLASTIQNEGYDESEPIVRFEGAILDGRHRREGSIMAEHEGPPFVDFVGTYDEATHYASKKFHRQHFNASQRAMFVAEARANLNAHHQKPSGKHEDGGGALMHPPPTVDESAKAADVSKRTMQHANKVVEQGTPKLQQAVKDGTLSATDAAKVAQQPKATQNKAVDAVKSGAARTASGVIEKAPILCRPCRIHGAKPGCNACKDARGEAAKEKKTERKPKDTLKDGYGNEVPARCRDAWADPWIDETVQTLRGLVSTFRQFRLGSAMDKRKKHYPFFDATDFIHGAGMIDNTFDKLIEHLETLRPSGVCPACSGAGCGGCRMAGMVPKAIYEKLKEKA
jgi:hypothetical protein